MTEYIMNNSDGNNILWGRLLYLYTPLFVHKISGCACECGAGWWVSPWGSKNSSNPSSLMHDFAKIADLIPLPPHCINFVHPTCCHIWMVKSAHQAVKLTCWKKLKCRNLHQLWFFRMAIHILVFGLTGKCTVKEKWFSQTVQWKRMKESGKKG